VVKGEVCKTSIHRFESGRRLHSSDLETGPVSRVDREPEGARVHELGGGVRSSGAALPRWLVQTAVLGLLLASVTAGCRTPISSPRPASYAELLGAVQAGRVQVVQQDGAEIRVRLTNGEELLVTVPNVLTDVQNDIANAAASAGRPAPTFEVKSAP
jgi:hypothetical protein